MKYNTVISFIICDFYIHCFILLINNHQTFPLSREYIASPNLDQFKLNMTIQYELRPAHILSSVDPIMPNIEDNMIL